MACVTVAGSLRSPQFSTVPMWKAHLAQFEKLGPRFSLPFFFFFYLNFVSTGILKLVNVFSCPTITSHTVSSDSILKSKWKKAFLKEHKKGKEPKDDEDAACFSLFIFCVERRKYNDPFDFPRKGRQVAFRPFLRKCKTSLSFFDLVSICAWFSFAMTRP